MEQMQYKLLFRWSMGLGIDDPVWVPTVFTTTDNCSAASAGTRNRGSGALPSPWARGARQTSKATAAASGQLSLGVIAGLR